MNRNETIWRATKQRPHQAPTAPKKSLNFKHFLKIAAVMLALAALYSTQHPDCRGNSVARHCVD